MATSRELIAHLRAGREVTVDLPETGHTVVRSVELLPSAMGAYYKIHTDNGTAFRFGAESIDATVSDDEGYPDEPVDHQPILPPRDGRPTSLPTYSDDRPF